MKLSLVQLIPFCLSILWIAESQATFTDQERAMALTIVELSSHLISERHIAVPKSFNRIKLQHLEMTRTMISTLSRSSTTFPISPADLDLFQKIFSNAAFLVQIQEVVPHLSADFSDSWTTWRLLQQFWDDSLLLLSEMQQLQNPTAEDPRWNSAYSRSIGFITWAIEHTKVLHQQQNFLIDPEYLKFINQVTTDPSYPPLRYQPLFPDEAASIKFSESSAFSLWSGPLSDSERLDKKIIEAERAPQTIVKSLWSALHFEMEREFDPVRRKELIERISDHINQPLYLVRLLQSSSIRGQIRKPATKLAAKAIFDRIISRFENREIRRRDQLALPELDRYLAPEDRKKIKPHWIIAAKTVSTESSETFFVSLFDEGESKEEESLGGRRARVPRAQQKHEKKSRPASNAQSSEQVVPRKSEHQNSWRRTLLSRKQFEYSPSMETVSEETDPLSLDTQTNEAMELAQDSLATNLPLREATERTASEVALASAQVSLRFEIPYSSLSEPDCSLTREEYTSVITPPGSPLEITSNPLQSPPFYENTLEDEAETKEKKRLANKKKKTKQKQSALNKKLRDWTNQIKTGKAKSQSELLEMNKFTAELFVKLKRNPKPSIDMEAHFEFLYEFNRGLVNLNVRIFNFKALYELSRSYNYNENFYQMRILLELTGLGENDWRLNPVTPEEVSIERDQMKKEVGGALKGLRFHKELKIEILVERLLEVAKTMEPGEDLREFLLNLLKLYLNHSTLERADQYSLISESFFPKLELLGIRPSEFFQAIQRGSTSKQRSYTTSDIFLTVLRNKDIEHLKESRLNFDKILLSQKPHSTTLSTSELINGIKDFIDLVLNHFNSLETQNKFRAFMLMRLIETDFDKRLAQGELFRYVFSGYSNSVQKASNCSSQVSDRQVWLETLDSFGHRPDFREQVNQEFNFVTESIPHWQVIREILHLVRKNILDPIPIRKSQLDKLPLNQLVQDKGPFHPQMIELSNLTNFINILIMLKMHGVPIEEIMNYAQNKFYSFKSTNEAELNVILDKLKSKKWPGAIPTDQYLVVLATTLLITKDLRSE